MESTEKSLLLGTPGDYRPMAYHEPFTDSYRGFDIELAWRIAAELGYEVVFKEIFWDMLAHDAKTDAFDMAIGGISRTPQRKEELILSDSYLETGKTILCREVDAARFGSLADVDRPGVRVLYNPGGTNEDFVKTHLHHADCRYPGLHRSGQGGCHDHGDGGGSLLHAAGASSGRTAPGASLHA